MKKASRYKPGKHIMLWFQDEARFGQQGTLTRVWAERGSRPRAYRQTEYEWVYVFASVCPATGDTHACLFPWVNTDVMEAYLADFSRHLERNVHALLILDGAGWHTATRLRVPDNVTLQSLPPKSPELNPAELPWREMRQKHLGNRGYPTVEELDDAGAKAWLATTQNKDSIRSLCAFDWITNIGNF